MRTTLTLEDDVAKRLERLGKKSSLSMKDIVNRALRAGLDALESPAHSGKRFQTKSLSVGEMLLPSLDDVTEVLAVAEGENHR